MPELSRWQQEALDALTATAGVEIKQIRWDRLQKSPKLIRGVLSTPSGDDAETIALTFLDRTGDLVDLPEGVQEMMTVSNGFTDAQGFQHVTLQQMLNGVRVFEGSVQVHINPAGQVVEYKANRLTQLEVNITPTIPRDQALETARERFGETVSTKVPPESQLTLFNGRDDSIHLAWYVQLFNDEDVATYHYFVDAHSGTILYQFNDLHHFAARETYTADNQEVLPGQLIIEEGDGSHPDPVAWDAHSNALTVHDYFFQNFGRNSYDGRGAVLRSTVHYSQRFNNAFWQPSLSQMVYGDGDGVRFSPLSGDADIVAHELTHAVTSNTARFVYAEEAGALDESFADFFAVMATNNDPVTNWQLGEQSFTPGRPGDALRNVSDPPLRGQPDHTDDQRHLALATGELPQCNPRLPGYNDNGWVHSNSGIPNKAGYLMVSGGTHHGVAVEPLGKSAAQQIMYLALAVYLESASLSRWTFRQARIATIDACEELYPGDDARLASVMNAWAAVGVGEAFGSAPPEPAPTSGSNWLTRIWNAIKGFFWLG